MTKASVNILVGHTDVSIDVQTLLQKTFAGAAHPLDHPHSRFESSSRRFFASYFSAKFLFTLSDGSNEVSFCPASKRSMLKVVYCGGNESQTSKPKRAKNNRRSRFGKLTMGNETTGKRKTNGTRLVR